jgi:hypothetical protein
VADEHPAVVQKLKSKAQSFAQQLEDNQMGVRYVTHEEADSAYADDYD